MCFLTETRVVASKEGFVLHLWYQMVSDTWKFLLYVKSPFPHFEEYKCDLHFLFISFQCSDKSCLRTPSLKKRVIDINLEGKKDSGMLKYIRNQVLIKPCAS